MPVMLLLKRLAGLGSASVANIGLTAVLSLVLAKILTSEDFGITRTVTAYLIGLSMLGHFAIHDALSSFVAKTLVHTEVKLYFSAATLLVTLISNLFSFVFGLIIFYSGFWSEGLENALYSICFTLPFVSLTLVYNASLQATGSYKAFAGITLMSSLLPLLIIVPYAYWFKLNGWILGRIITALLLFILSWLTVRHSFDHKFWNAQLPPKLRDLWGYARIQIISGILSLVMLSADVVLLEWFTHDLVIVANYGLASLFVKAGAIFSATLGRLYFKELAQVTPHGDGTKIVRRFLLLNVLAGLVISLLIAFIAPWLIERIYAEDFLAAESLLIDMCMGGVFLYLFSGLSVINVAQGFTRIAASMSLICAVCGILLLMFCVPTWQGAGTVWSMNITYCLGCISGVYFLAKKGML